MDELEIIKNRISKTKQNKNKIYKIMMTLLLIASLGIGFLIYARLDPNGSLMKKAFNVNIDFNSLNDKVDDILDRMFNFNIVNNNDDDQLVSGEVGYISLGNDLYSLEDQRVLTLNKGLVSHVEKDNDSYFVIISYPNSVKATYFFIYDVIVKIGDELKKGDQIATYETSFKVLFFKGDKKITYEEAIS